MNSAYFEAGLVELGRGSYAAALGSFGKACGADPGNPLYDAHRAWAKYQVDRIRLGREDRQLATISRNSCKAILQKSVKKRAEFDAAHVFLGRIVLDEGDSTQAKVHFRKALVINTENLEAARLLKELSAADAAEAARRRPRARKSLGARISDWFGGRKAGSSEAAIKPIRVKTIHGQRDM